MSEFKIIMQSPYLYEIEIAKSKLASRGIVTHIKNEFVNNVVIMPLSDNYILIVNERDAEMAHQILSEASQDEAFGER